eukprot:CCRYP_011278-RA/>CCRYP_011278-RA protein AED:0.45 eAED:1.00 QI:0/-1/0/1/-1/1/1/0/162
MEKVELSSRLSAFDSFLFLVQTKDEVQKQEIIRSDRVGGIAEPRKDGVKTMAPSDARLRLSGRKRGEGNYISYLGDHVVKRNNITATSASSLRVHESNVRCIPGSREERREMSNRLKPFDEYMFLLDCESEKVESGVKSIATKPKALKKEHSTKKKLLTKGN